MSLDKSKTNSLPSYKTPPVIEVVCGINFKKIEKFKAAHSGLFWQKLRSDYPKCQHAPPLGFPSKPMEFEADPEFPFPLPRLWFINEKEDGLVQLQNNRFLYNWRKILPEESYPRYHMVISAFKKNLDIFKTFLEEESLGSINLIECELTYVNHILKEEGWESPADIHGIMSDLNWRLDVKRFLPEPRNLGWNATFTMPEDNGRLYVQLEQKIRQIDKRPLFILQLIARGLGADKSEEAMWKWFDLAHKWIVCGFTDLTNAKIQTEIWQREDNIKEVQ